MYKSGNSIWSKEVSSISKLEIQDKAVSAYKISL